VESWLIVKVASTPKHLDFNIHRTT
jgi:hypothetical protein